MAASKVNLVYWDTGSGIAKDTLIVDRILQSHGFDCCRVRTKDRSSKWERRLKYLNQLIANIRRPVAQFHFEQIHREQFRFSSKNFIFVNPEFTDCDVFAKFPGNQPVVLAKTRYAEQLFRSNGLNSRYVGFTGIDHKVETGQKNYRRFLHICGYSDYKGTDVLIDAWRNNPSWPELTIVRPSHDRWGNPRKSIHPPGNVNVIQKWLSESDLLTLMNKCGTHLCPSTTEGFGHYIVEALSTGAIVLTTDAPPMNELVGSEFGYLLGAESAGKMGMSDTWKVKGPAIMESIEKILNSEKATLLQKGELARRRYLEIDRQFRQNFHDILEEHGIIK